MFISCLHVLHWQAICIQINLTVSNLIHQVIHILNFVWIVPIRLYKISNPFWKVKLQILNTSVLCACLRKDMCILTVIPTTFRWVFHNTAYKIYNYHWNMNNKVRAVYERIRTHVAAYLKSLCELESCTADIARFVTNWYSLKTNDSMPKVEP